MSSDYGLYFHNNIISSFITCLILQTKISLNLIYQHMFKVLLCNYDKLHCRSVTRSYYRGAAGALLVYDITRLVSFCTYTI